MKGVDTNILMRYLTKDDPGQFAKASELIQGAEARDQRLLVNTIVVCELAWTLRGGRYRFERAEIASAIEKLLETPLFEIQSHDQVKQAVREYRAGRADLADYLIGQENLAAGCSSTATFDTKLAGSPTFEVLELP